VSERRIETAKRIAVSHRNYRRARERALTRLAQAYPDQYKQYLEEEKASDEFMGKKWTDITGSTATTFVDTRAKGSITGSPTTNDGEDEGDRGGEA
jgi:hypothetical protein